METFRKTDSFPVGGQSSEVSTAARDTAPLRLHDPLCLAGRCCYRPGSP
jgi:hypothetical protein